MRAKQLTALAPIWYQPTETLLQIWLFSEVIVMLTNRRRRALHDFIAGTIVIRDVPRSAAQVDEHGELSKRGRSAQARPPLGLR